MSEKMKRSSTPWGDSFLDSACYSEEEREEEKDEKGEEEKGGE